MTYSNLWSSGSKGLVRYETNATWPTVNKVFNVSAFRNPDTRNTERSEGVDQRAQGYPALPVGFSSRGLPQLTWFEGVYQVPTNPHGVFCTYPNLVGPWNANSRECLDPGKLTPEELEAKRREQQEVENNIAAKIREQGDLPEYTGPVVRGVDGAPETQYEREVRGGLTKSYRTTEVSLAVLLLAGAYLIWRS